MKKRFSILALSAMLALTGCGQDGAGTPKDASSVTSTPDGSGTSSDASPGADAKKDTPGGSKEGDTQGSAGDTQPEKGKNPSTETLTPKEGYADAAREISILGLKKYSKLKSDIYTDKPAKGKEYLVLFLKVRNRSNKNEYINVGNLKAELDGKAIESTYLVNQPEGYPTLFQNVPAGTDTAGFIVWEVPKGWKELEVSYDGWRYSDDVVLEMTLTPKELAEPDKFGDL